MLNSCYLTNYILYLENSKAFKGLAIIKYGIASCCKLIKVLCA